MGRFDCICITIGDPIIKRGWVGISITGLTLPHFCACPMPGPRIPTSYVVVFFIFNWFKVGNDCCFVDIGGFVAYHCLNFHFIDMMIFVLSPPPPFFLSDFFQLYYVAVLTRITIIARKKKTATLMSA